MKAFNKNIFLSVRDIKNGWIYFSSNLYYKSTEKKNWTESRKDCREREGDLVIIKSKEEQVRDTCFLRRLKYGAPEGAWRKK